MVETIWTGGCFFPTARMKVIFPFQTVAGGGGGREKPQEEEGRERKKLITL